MLFLILFVLTVMTLCWFVWPWLDGTSETSSQGRLPQEPASCEGTCVSRPESLEGVLTAQLAAGAITCGQYVKAMEGLAARDDERHPLAVPPEIGPADA